MLFLRKKDVTPGRVGRHVDPQAVTSGNETSGDARYNCLHVVVVRILADVADIENDGLLAEVLPPVRGTGDFRPDLAGLVHDRLGAVAGIFDDLALLDEDQRGTVVMAVPGHDAARLHRQLAEAQLAIPDIGRLLLEVDRAKRHVGNADRLGVDHRADVGLHLAGRAFARNGGRGGGDRTCDYSGKCETLPDGACSDVGFGHVMVSSVSVFALRFAWAENELAGYVITIEETARKRKCRLAFDSIAPRYAASRGRACA